jgi:hypothetical protein
MAARLVKVEDVFDVDRFIADVEAYRRRHRVRRTTMARAAAIQDDYVGRIFDRRILSLQTAVCLAAWADLKLDDYVVGPDGVSAIAVRLFGPTLEPRKRSRRRVTTLTPKIKIDTDRLAVDIRARATELGYDQPNLDLLVTWAVNTRDGGYLTDDWRIARRLRHELAMSDSTVIGVLTGTSQPQIRTVVKLATWLERDPADYVVDP